MTTGYDKFERRDNSVTCRECGWAIAWNVNDENERNNALTAIQSHSTTDCVPSVESDATECESGENASLLAYYLLPEVDVTSLDDIRWYLAFDRERAERDANVLRQIDRDRERVKEREREQRERFTRIPPKHNCTMNSDWYAETG